MIYERKQYTEDDTKFIETKTDEIKSLMNDINKYYIKMFNVENGSEWDDGPIEMQILRSAYRGMDELRRQAETILINHGAVSRVHSKGRYKGD